MFSWVRSDRRRRAIFAPLGENLLHQLDYTSILFAPDTAAPNFACSFFNASF
jgi:hypothetical protein